MMVEVKAYGATAPTEFDVDAVELSLSFVNTADWHASAQPDNLLKEYADFVTWAQVAGVIDQQRAERLSLLSDHEPVQAAAVLQRALALRETLYRSFTAVLQGSPVGGDELKTLNSALPEALSHRQLQSDSQGVRWQWQIDGRVLRSLLWPVVYAASELLTSERMAQIGQCQDDRGCGWLFLDSSRNHSRRWCSMERCGNRAKAQRHYQRSKEKARS